MKYYDNFNEYNFMNRRNDRGCKEPCGSECHRGQACCRRCGQDICINNNPVIKICPNGTGNGTEQPEPFLSSYVEVLGTGQTIPTGGNVIFDIESIDNVGNNIELDATGTVFTINRPGLYHVEWNLNLASGTTSAVVGILENGEPASGSATVTGGNFSSGTVIQVDTVPFTLSLRNYGSEITIADVNPFEDSAASIRIVRFADAPSA